MISVPPEKIASLLYRRGEAKEKFIMFTEALVIMIVLEIFMLY
jgi:hypothetical protein